MSRAQMRWDEMRWDEMRWDEWYDRSFICAVAAVCPSVCLSVCLSQAGTVLNGWTDRDGFFGVEVTLDLSDRVSAYQILLKSNGFRDIVILSIFKMVSVRLLGFFKYWNFTGWWSLPPCQILSKSSIRCENTTIFDFSKWRPSAILDFQVRIFFRPIRSGRPICNSMPNQISS